MVVCMDIFLDVITVNLDDFQDWPANVSLVIVATSVSPTRTTFQSFHRGSLWRGFHFRRRTGLGLSHMTVRHWVEVLQSEAVSLYKFVMGQPGRGSDSCYREFLSKQVVRIAKWLFSELCEFCSPDWITSSADPNCLYHTTCIQLSYNLCTWKLCLNDGRLREQVTAL